ncbi:cell envelope integrity protein CreD [Terrimonas ferruginea]|uniref:cell envelope integrity protein CreD n=1 Tax=Terrimonas ferruginea TaxID=249 RepID=UPI0004103696|nr:cell envelope integrity protein CreD [Terrimonas ferruginea]
MENSPTSALSGLMDKGKFFFKGLVIFGIALLLWVPTLFILEIVRERELRQQQASADINQKWAGPQKVTSPVIAVPYKIGGNMIYLMPDKADVSTRVATETRRRGIYEVPVYRSSINISGSFAPADMASAGVEDSLLDWDRALLILPVKDALRGIREDIRLQWGDETLTLLPQYDGADFLKDAYYVRLPLSQDKMHSLHQFNLQFNLNGSGELLFASAARDTRIKMESGWKDPSFQGSMLPETREVGDSGFVANWKFLNRNTPQVWINRSYSLEPLTVGTVFMLPVDGYDKTRRAVKYALLCIILTFVAFLLIELVYKRSLLLVHYGLAGLALVLFYTLLLSVSEYTGFNWAYCIAGVATIALVTWYTGGILKSARISLFICLVLTAVYGYIFSIIQLQDFSLLMGSIGLFIALAIVMYFSRRLQQ